MGKRGEVETARIRLMRCGIPGIPDADFSLFSLPYLVAVMIVRFKTSKTAAVS